MRRYGSAVPLTFNKGGNECRRPIIPNPRFGIDAPTPQNGLPSISVPQTMQFPQITYRSKTADFYTHQANMYKNWLFSIRCISIISILFVLYPAEKNCAQAFASLSTISSNHISRFIPAKSGFFNQPFVKHLPQKHNRGGLRYAKGRFNIPAYKELFFFK